MADNLQETPLERYPDVVTIRDIQDILHIGKNAVYDLLRENRIKSIRLGKKYIVPKRSIIRFLELSVQ